MIRRPALLLLIAALLATTAVAAPVKGTLKEAPDVTLTAVSGKTIRLADLKGKVVLLDFWASWCIPCRKSFPAIDALHRELEPRGLAVVAVSVDEELKNAHAFLEQFPHTMTIALDPKGAAAEAFKVNAMPSTMILDRDGRIRYSHKGYTGKSIANFRSQVIELLAEAE
jgi:peroxiredoxin